MAKQAKFKHALANAKTDQELAECFLAYAGGPYPDSTLVGVSQVALSAMANEDRQCWTAVCASSELFDDAYSEQVKARLKLSKPGDWLLLNRDGNRTDLIAALKLQAQTLHPQNPPRLMTLEQVAKWFFQSLRERTIAFAQAQAKAWLSQHNHALVDQVPARVSWLIPSLQGTQTVFIADPRASDGLITLDSNVLLEHANRPRFSVMIGQFGRGKTTQALMTANANGAVLYFDAKTVSHWQRASTGTNPRLAGWIETLDVYQHVDDEKLQHNLELWSADELGKAAENADSPYVFVIDGLDENPEYTSSASLAQLVADLAEFRRPVLLTTRTSHFAATFGNLSEPLVLKTKRNAHKHVYVIELLAWRATEVEHYIQDFCNSVPEAKHAQIKVLSQPATLAKYPLLFEPLFLSCATELIAENFAADLGNPDALLMDWAELKIRRDFSKPRTWPFGKALDNLDDRIAQLLDFMAELARHLLAQEQQGTEEALAGTLSGEQINTIAIQRGLSSCDADALCMVSLLESYGYKTRLERRRYRFSHRAFLERFAKAAISRDAARPTTPLAPPVIAQNATPQLDASAPSWKRFERWWFKDCAQDQKQGGNAAIQLLYDERGKKSPIAVKKQRLPTSDIVRFRREIDIAKHIDLSLTILDWDREHYQWYVMRYFSGGSLREAINKGVSPEDAQNWSMELAGQLDFIHRKGVLHRDLKPENIMLDALRKVNIVDFGIAVFQDQLGNQTVDPRIGTQGYMAPERGDGAQATIASEIYEFARTVAELLHAAGLTQQAQWMRQIGMHTDPSQRPASASELWKRVLTTLEAEKSNADHIERYRASVEKRFSELDIPVYGKLDVNKSIELKSGDLNANEESLTFVSAYIDQKSKGSSKCDAHFNCDFNRRMVILGGPGSGKTSLMRRIAYRLSRRGQIVAYVKLQNVAQRMRSTPGFLPALKTELATEFPNFNDAVWLHAEQVLLDGLDECGDQQSAIVAGIQTLANDSQTKARIGITSRVIGFEARSWPHWQLQKLNHLSDPINEFEKLAPVGVTAKPWKKVLGKTVTVQMLSLYAALASHQTSPPKHQAQALLQLKELMARGGSNRTEALDEEAVLKLLGYWLVESDFSITAREIEKRIAQKLAMSGVTTQQVSRVLTFWKTQRLLERVELGIEQYWVYAHRQFAELDAALWVLDQPEVERGKMLTQMLAETRWFATLELLVLQAGYQPIQHALELAPGEPKALLTAAKFVGGDFNDSVRQLEGLMLNALERHDDSDLVIALIRLPKLELPEISLAELEQRAPNTWVDIAKLSRIYAVNPSWKRFIPKYEPKQRVDKNGFPASGIFLADFVPIEAARALFRDCLSTWLTKPDLNALEFDDLHSVHHLMSGTQTKLYGARLLKTNGWEVEDTRAIVRKEIANVFPKKDWREHRLLEFQALASAFQIDLPKHDFEDRDLLVLRELLNKFRWISDPDLDALDSGITHAAAAIAAKNLPVEPSLIASSGQTATKELDTASFCLSEILNPSPSTPKWRCPETIAPVQIIELLFCDHQGFAYIAARLLNDMAPDPIAATLIEQLWLGADAPCHSIEFVGRISELWGTQHHEKFLARLNGPAADGLSYFAESLIDLANGKQDQALADAIVRLCLQSSSSEASMLVAQWLRMDELMRPLDQLRKVFDYWLTHEQPYPERFFRSCGSDSCLLALAKELQSRREWSANDLERLKKVAHFRDEIRRLIA
jgi:serine/threonine protein kinase/nucleotide-binding universal stress UspA family protein